MVNCADYQPCNVDEAVNRIFNLLGGVDQFIKNGQNVLIKPNLIAPKAARLAVQTDGALIVAIAKYILDHGAKPFIADSPAWGDVHSCVRELGVADELKRLCVEVRPLNKPRLCYIPSAGAYVGLSSAALDADAVINVPKLKSHQQLVATIAVKNMFGCVSGKWKPFWHYARGSSSQRFCSLLWGIYERLAPVLTIVDGVIAMEGPGPINGHPRHLGMLCASPDPLACEIACATAIGLDPMCLPIIQNAGRAYAKIEDIEILGDKLVIYPDFAAAQLIPIRFTLSRVAKSAAKQLFRRICRRQNHSC